MCIRDSRRSRRWRKRSGRRLATDTRKLLLATRGALESLQGQVRRSSSCIGPLRPSRRFSVAAAMDRRYQAGRQRQCFAEILGSVRAPSWNQRQANRGNRLGKRDVSLYAKRRNQKSNQTRSWHRVHPRGRSAHATERLSEDSILRMAKSQQSRRPRRSSLAGDAVPRSCVLFMGIHQVTQVGWTSLQRLRRKPANDFGDRPRGSSVVPKRARLPR